MSREVHLIAIVSPREGKVERVAELLTDMCNFVKENEPRTLRYQLHQEINKKTGVDDLVMLESYADMDAVKAHGETDAFKMLYKVIRDEDLVTGPTQLKWVKSVGGFSSRL